MVVNNMCANTVSFNEYNYRTGNTIEFNVPCGNSVMLETRLCKNCEDRANKQYPQGWKSYPGDVCKHGVYVGGCMEDYMCGICEGE